MVEEPPSQPSPTADVGGLIIANNKTIRSFLISSAEDLTLDGELWGLASRLASESTVPYKSLRRIWSLTPSSARPGLLRLFSGSDFVLPSPKPREKSEELKERLRKLSEMAERRAYEELVRDVVPKKEVGEPFSSYKDQLGFGLHVVLTMFTGFLVGYAAFRALFNHNPILNVAGGIFGLVCGMLLETVLFIIKTSNRNDVSSYSASNVKKSQ
ncbi:hypothetical protein QJS04_geneDACA001778 [Acorus gramineus]|uniref:ATPase, vacuolar ER assembly factor, Vma12 n=1 Tax=Acorus gramineus TaxID=55184 RepID=A0AAV9BFP5_ACOGR|nr:hypothetical protein QJS04_geneDACA001778 [Acorus gramineus]